MNLAIWLERRAASDPGRPALYQGTDLLADYAGFRARAAGLAGWLAAQGVVPGSRVAIFRANAPDYLVALWGIWYAGAVAVPINAKLHAREAAFILGNAGARIVLTDPARGQALRHHDPACRIVTGLPEAAEADPPAAPVARAPEDLAWLFYTSGTTGRPKGVQITHGMLMMMSLTYFADVDAAGGEDAAIYAAPMSHGAGLYNMLHVLVGARHVCPASGGFEPLEILDLAAHFGRAHMFAAPTMVKRLTDAARAAGRDGAGLRTVVYGGGPMYGADIVAAVEHFGPVFVQIYGQGECPMAITALGRAAVADRSHPRWRERLGSVGRAQAPVEVRIGDAAGAPVPSGTPGEIMVRGPLVMPGYWQAPEATAAAFHGAWLRTGDIGTMDGEGYVTLRDRSKDMIVTGGSNVYPREVEEVLIRHPEVQEVAVVGRPHPDWGEEVVAFFVGTAAPDALDALCLDQIARFKRPKAYFAISELPKNNYGKVLKTELRSRPEIGTGRPPEA